MIDVRNFRFQSSDGGASTSTTGSRSSAPSCPRPMTREYEFLFFRFFSFLRFFLVARSPLSPPPLVAISLSSQFSYSSLYPLHISHGPLFPVRDPLRRVSPGQVLETRGFHLIWTGSPFFVPSRSLLPSAFLPLALHGRSLFLPLSQLCFPSFLPSKRNTSFDPVNESKCEGKITPQIGNTGRKRLEKRRVCLHCTHFIVPFITLVYSLSVLNKLIYKINFS